MPPAEGWQLANPSSPCCQQDSPASRSHLVLERSCGNPRALQPSEHRLLSSASPSWSAPVLCLQWAQGAGSSTGRVKHTRVPPGDRTELGDSLAQPHHLQQQDHNGMGEMWPPPHGLKPQPEATLLLLAAAPAPSLAALQSLHAAPLARGHAGTAVPTATLQSARCHGDPTAGTGAQGRAGGGLPSRRHSSCCHRSCLLERGGRRSGEPGRAPGPGGRGSAAWCRAAEPRGSPPLSSRLRHGHRSSGVTPPAPSSPSGVPLHQGHDRPRTSRRVRGVPRTGSPRVGCAPGCWRRGAGMGRPPAAL